MSRPSTCSRLASLLSNPLLSRIRPLVSAAVVLCLPLSFRRLQSRASIKAGLLKDQYGTGQIMVFPGSSPVLKLLKLAAEGLDPVLLVNQF